jgi:NADH-quinone oxidoreductase subunit A
MTNQFKAMILLENSILKKEYLILLIFLIFAIFLTVLIIGASYFVARQNPESEKLSAYECGFEPYEDTRHTFDIRFCVIAILFIVRALKRLLTGFYTEIIMYRLKGWVYHLGFMLKSFLRVVFSTIYQVILSVQKAAVTLLSKIQVCLKKNTMCLQHLITNFLTSLGCIYIMPKKFTKLSGPKEFKICNSSAGHTNGILPKCTSYKRLLFVTGETRKYFSTLISKFDNELVSDIKNMDIIKANLFLNDGQLFTRAVSVDSLKKAWVSTKHKFGWAFKGVNSLSAVWFIQANKKLLEGSFKYPDRIRMLINNPNSREKLVSIANIVTKIIEIAIFTALEPQFEGYHVWENISKKRYSLEVKRNKVCSNYKMMVTQIGGIHYFKKRIICQTVFYPENYGFRPNKSAHQALKAVRHWKFNTTFLMDYNISTVYTAINNKRLKNIFKKKVKDFRFWGEISKILNAGVVHELRLIFGFKKVFQAGILGPFLYNVYMHEFDERVIQLQKLSKSTNKFYESIVYKGQESTKGYGHGTSDVAIHNLKRLAQNGESSKIFLKVREIVSKNHHQKVGHCKKTGTRVVFLQYARYLYDFILGVVGGRKYAGQIRKNLNNFIKSNLHLVVKKDSIVHRNEKSVRFLDHLISFREYQLKPTAVSKSTRALQKNKHRSMSKFLESDKRLAKSKSYQFYSNVLRQFDILSGKLQMGVRKKSHVSVLASIIAYKYIGGQLMRKISINCWKKFNKLMSFVNLDKLSSKRNANPVLTRWFLNLQKESDMCSELSARILYSNIVSLASAEWHVHLSIGQADKIKKLQQNYLIKMGAILKESLKGELEKKQSKMFYNHYFNRNGEEFNSSTKKVCDGSIRKLRALPEREFFLRKVSINAPIKDICLKLKLMGHIHSMKSKSIGYSSLSSYADSVIVTQVNSLIFGMLSWYSGVDNFGKVKSLVQLLRKNCILTLAAKHKKPVHWVQAVYGEDVVVLRGKEKIQLRSKASILSHRNQLNMTADFFFLYSWNVGQVPGFFTKLSRETAFIKSCFVMHCLQFGNHEVYSICQPYNLINCVKLSSIFHGRNIKIIKLTSIVIHINRKRLSLCAQHYMEFKFCTFSFLDYFNLNKSF